ncbi:DUF1203 domain-containing protein [Xanthomonas campestris pv. plantaginis]|uniref:DUF1203 domain-containing protein n=1 Tax=Xanthomonas campestris TaxID=339 RepID=UPI002B23CDEB|nr:DUF1203 domain-containing protein [Xanthomonas campestris]MEA9608562.1 DUF1203 domain-containing protein [Xanthomonas campestris pv. plantaginis]
MHADAAVSEDGEQGRHAWVTLRFHLWKTAMTSFRLTGLDPALFAQLHMLDDVALANHQAVRVIADADDGFPCRVSLQDARAGEQLLLLPYLHQAADSPYRASGPIFVRAAAARAQLEPDAVPDAIRSRLISLRAYDRRHHLTTAEVCAGEDVAAWLHACLDDAQIAYVHLHHARQGCYACRADRTAVDAPAEIFG